MEFISVAKWTDEDIAIFWRLMRRGRQNLLNDSLIADKCDSFRMLRLSAVKPDHATRAFGGLSPSEISDTSALRCKHGIHPEWNVCEDCMAEDWITNVEEVQPERSDKTTCTVSDTCDHVRAPLDDQCIKCGLTPLSAAFKRDRRCQVGVMPVNPPLYHELLPEFICDVRTSFGPWFWLCPACAAAFGYGFGLGKGQRFVNDGSLRKVEG